MLRGLEAASRITRTRHAHNRTCSDLFIASPLSGLCLKRRARSVTGVQGFHTRGRSAHRVRLNAEALMPPLRILAIGGALLSASAVVALAQIPPPPPGRTYAFEVASVKPSAPEERLRVFDFKPTGSLTVRNQTLRKLIAAAYGTPFPIPLPDERIVGGPGWLGTARFAIDARSALPPEGATAARDIGFMLRTLLADRFGLQVRLEPRPQRVYALVRAPG